MWGSHPPFQDQDSHTLPTEPSRHPFSWSLLISQWANIFQLLFFHYIDCNKNMEQWKVPLIFVLYDDQMCFPFFPIFCYKNFQTIQNSWKSSSVHPCLYGSIFNYFSDLLSWLGLDGLHTSDSVRKWMFYGFFLGGSLKYLQSR